MLPSLDIYDQQGLKSSDSEVRTGTSTVSSSELPSKSVAKFRLSFMSTRGMNRFAAPTSPTTVIPSPVQCVASPPTTFVPPKLPFSTGKKPLSPPPLQSRSKSQLQTQRERKKNAQIERPKRPHTAYNLFFLAERAKIVKTRGGSGFDDDYGDVVPSVMGRVRGCSKHFCNETGISFSDMARNIRQKWKVLDVSQRVVFEAEAEKDRRRYRTEMEKNRQALHVIGERHYDTSFALKFTPTPALISSEYEEIASIELAKQNQGTVNKVSKLSNVGEKEMNPQLNFLDSYDDQNKNTLQYVLPPGSNLTLNDPIALSLYDSAIQLENDLRESLDDDILDYLITW